MERIPVLITCAGGPGGISMIKSLSPIPRLSVVAVDSEVYSTGLYRPEIHAGYLVPRGDDPRYVEVMLKVAERERVRVIIPGSDEEVIALSQNMGRFEAIGTRIPVSDWETVRKAVDKSITMEIAHASGVPAPRTALVASAEQLAAAGFGLPVVLKPATARGGRGVIIAETRKAADEALATLLPEYGRVIAQENIPGGPGTIYCFCAQFDWDGNLRASYMARSLRTKFDFGGPALVGEPVEEPLLRTYTLRLLSAVGRWRGPVMVEFKRDERDGSFKLLEINARYWGYSFLATAAGINFPYHAVQVALGETFEVQHEHRTDIVSIRSNEDIIVEKKDLKRPWW